MRVKFAILTLATVLTQSAFAAVTLSVPEEIVVLAVNDQALSAGLLRGQRNQYQLDAGTSRLTVRYQQLFEQNNGEHDVLKSGAVTLQTPALQDGAVYSLALVNAPQNYDAAQAFSKQPTVALLNASGQVLLQQTGANTETKTLIGKGLLHRVYDLTSNKTTRNQPAPVYTVSQTPSAVINNTVVATPIEATATDSKPVDLEPVHSKSRTSISAGVAKDQQLIQLWQQASKAERQNFLNWITDQAK